MQRALVVLFLVAFGAGGGVARLAASADPGLPASTREVREELIAVVEGQLAAFRDGDTAKAYGYASRALRAQHAFPVFLAIVEENYPEIWRNTRAEFGLARDNGRRATLRVVVHAADARAAYDFILVPERGGWRIEGVLRRAPGKGSQV